MAAPTRDTLFRLWNESWFAGPQFDGVDLNDGRPVIRTFALDADHPAAKWITDRAGDLPTHLTIDRDGDRWTGHLSEYEVSRIDGRTFLTATWIADVIESPVAAD